MDLEAELINARREIALLSRAPDQFDKDLASASLKRENDRQRRRADIITNLYAKLSDFLDGDGDSIGFGLFCNIDITEADIEMHLIDFLLI